jgi:hypothetical protein
MRLSREPMTIAIGQTISNGINLGQEKFVGIKVNQAPGGNGTDIRVQTLVSGNLGDAATEVWADINVVAVPAGTFGTLKVTSGPIATGVYIFPRDTSGYPLAVIRLVAQAAVSTTALIAQAISDPHS